MAYGARLADALRTAAEVHRDQVRKGTSIPYVGHLLSVCSLVVQAGGDEDEAIAALLHDALEDQPARISAATIRERYGERVLAIVQGCTDDVPWEEGALRERPRRDESTWLDRKKAYHAHLATADPSILRVSCADKIDNARAIVADYRALGEELWRRFHAGRDAQLWNYRALVEAFRERRGDFGEEAAWLVDELERQVGAMVELAAAGDPRPRGRVF